MRELGVSVAPPPPVDFESVPLERLLPVRTPRGGGTGMQPSHQVCCVFGGGGGREGKCTPALPAACAWSAAQAAIRNAYPQPCLPPPTNQTPQIGGGSEFVPGELDAVGEQEEGGEFDPDDLFEEGAGVVVEESAGEQGDGVDVHVCTP